MSRKYRTATNPMNRQEFEQIIQDTFPNQTIRISDPRQLQCQVNIDASDQSEVYAVTINRSFTVILRTYESSSIPVWSVILRNRVMFEEPTLDSAIARAMDFMGDLIFTD